jgi:hypothetical protein
MVDVLLPVPRIRQEQTNWCWAAAADMVADRYGMPEVRQCRLAQDLFNLIPDCCRPENAVNLETCNKGCDVEDVAPVYLSLGIGAQFTDGLVTFVDLVSEINDCRPVQVAFQWSGGPGGHVALVIGYGHDQDGYFFVVNDPLDQFQMALVRFDSLISAYGQGEWFWTWTDIQPI